MAFSVAKRKSIYIYTTLKFLALQGAPYIYGISRLRVKIYHRKVQCGYRLNGEIGTCEKYLSSMKGKKFLD
jgi:hypothetical protein